MLDCDRLGQHAPGDLDTEERRDLALLGKVDRLGTRQRQALTFKLVPDRSQLPGEQLGNQAERLTHGALLGDID